MMLTRGMTCRSSSYGRGGIYAKRSVDSSQRFCKIGARCISPWIYDVLNEEHASVSCGERVGRMYPTQSGSKLMVSLMNNSIKVFDKMDWTYERWSDLSGRCNSAVWTPDEQYLLFTTDKERFIYYIRFNPRGNTSRTFGNSYASVVYDLSEILLLDPEKETSDRTLGGSVKNMVINDDGNRLAVSFQDNPKNIALFIVDTSPFLNLIPGSFIEAPEFGIATHISFVPHFPKGAMLCIVWSGGKLQYVPLIYGKNREPFLYSSYASLNCSSIIGGLPASSAISPEPFAEGDKENEGLSAKELLKLSNIEKSISPTFNSRNNTSINLFSQSGVINDVSFRALPE
uniref:DPPIV_N domain-containing protein n=1 Tax=Steinernema glaseri TaxID=37863 RepID=A0A1I7ZSS2_9BILA